MEFPYPEGTRTKPDLSWVWTQAMHMVELQDAICQQWYAGYRHKNDELGGAPRTKANLDKEFVAIASLQKYTEELAETLADRTKALEAEYDERVQYDKDRRKK